MLVPLFPLPDVVLFPHTLLPLHIFEPRYRRLIADLLERPMSERRIGMILAVRTEEGAVELHEPGCIGRLVAHEPLDDGRSNIVLAGETRFAIDHEVEGKPYRQAVVAPLDDQIPLVAADRAESTHAELLALVSSVVQVAAERASVDVASLAGLGAPDRLSELVNRIAAQLDLPVTRKQALLAEPPLARGEELAGILRGRLKLLKTLAPFRHLAAHPESN